MHDLNSWLEQHLEATGLFSALEEAEVGPDDQDEPAVEAESPSFTDSDSSSTTSSTETSLQRKRSLDDMDEGEYDAKVVGGV